MTDKHGANISVGQYVKNSTGLIGEVIICDSYMAVKYPDDHTFYLSEDYAAHLELVHESDAIRQWLDSL